MFSQSSVKHLWPVPPSATNVSCRRHGLMRTLRSLRTQGRHWLQNPRFLSSPKEQKKKRNQQHHRHMPLPLHVHIFLVCSSVYWSFNFYVFKLPIFIYDCIYSSKEKNMISSILSSIFHFCYIFELFLLFIKCMSL